MALWREFARGWGFGKVDSTRRKPSAITVQNPIPRANLRHKAIATGLIPIITRYTDKKTLAAAMSTMLQCVQVHLHSCTAIFNCDVITPRAIDNRREIWHVRCVRECTKCPRFEYQPFLRFEYQPFLYERNKLDCYGLKKAWKFYMYISE